MKQRLLLGPVLALCMGPALAHDYWIVPARFVAPADQELTVSLYVGEDFVAEEERAFELGRFTRLAELHGARLDDLRPLGVEGSKPLLHMPLHGAGGHLLLVDRNPSHIELEAAKFEDYLRHEGQHGVLELRAQRGESGKPGRERYSRCLKALIQVGTTRDDTFGVASGQTLELVPESNPVFAKPGTTLTVQVLFRGAPLADARVESFSRDGSDVREASCTTDATGRARVAIDRRGIWLIRMVHMIRCADCPDADWESFWSSYTFASADPSGAAVDSPSMYKTSSGSAYRGDGTMRFVAVIAAAVAVGAGAFISWRRRRRRLAS